MYLKAIKGSVVFEHQDVVRDGENVAVRRDQTPQVDGLGFGHEREGTQNSRGCR